MQVGRITVVDTDALLFSDSASKKTAASGNQICDNTSKIGKRNLSSYSNVRSEYKQPLRKKARYENPSKNEDSDKSSESPTKKSFVGNDEDPSIKIVVEGCKRLRQNKTSTKISRCSAISTSVHLQERKSQQDNVSSHSVKPTKRKSPEDKTEAPSTILVKGHKRLRKKQSPRESSSFATRSISTHVQANPSQEKDDSSHSLQPPKKKRRVEGPSIEKMDEDDKPSQPIQRSNESSISTITLPTDSQQSQSQQLSNISLEKYLEFSTEETRILTDMSAFAVKGEYVWNGLQKEALSKLKTNNITLKKVFLKLILSNTILKNYILIALTDSIISLDPKDILDFLIHNSSIVWWPCSALATYEIILEHHQCNNFVFNRALKGKTIEEEICEGRAELDRYVLIQLSRFNDQITIKDSLSLAPSYPEEFVLPPPLNSEYSEKLQFTEKQKRFTGIILEKKGWEVPEQTFADQEGVSATQVAISWRPARTASPSLDANIYFKLIKENLGNLYVILRVLRGRSVPSEIEDTWKAYGIPVTRRLKNFLEKGIIVKLSIPSLRLRTKKIQKEKVSELRKVRKRNAARPKDHQTKAGDLFSKKEIVALVEILEEALKKDGKFKWYEDQKLVEKWINEIINSTNPSEKIERRILMRALRKLLNDPQFIWLSKELVVYGNKIEFYSRNQFVQREILKGRKPKQEKIQAVQEMDLKIFRAFQRCQDDLKLSEDMKENLVKRIENLESEKILIEESVVPLPELRIKESVRQLAPLDERNLGDIYMKAVRKKDSIRLWHYPEEEACNKLASQSTPQQLSTSWRGTGTPWPFPAWDTFNSFLIQQQKNPMVRLRIFKGSKPKVIAQRGWENYDVLVMPRLEKWKIVKKKDTNKKVQ